MMISRNFLWTISLSLSAMLNLTFFTQNTLHGTRRGGGEKFLIHAGTLYEKTREEEEGDRRHNHLLVRHTTKPSHVKPSRWDEIDLEDLWCLCFESYRICTWNAAPPATAMNYTRTSSVQHRVLHIVLRVDWMGLIVIRTSEGLSLRTRHFTSPGPVYLFGYGLRITLLAGENKLKFLHLISYIKFPVAIIPKVHTECPSRVDSTLMDGTLHHNETHIGNN